MGMVAYFRAATPAQMTELRDHPDRIDTFMYDGSSDSVDFDVAWHIVHYLLTGSESATDAPLGLILDGLPPIRSGPHIGDTEFWLVSPERMRAFADALDGLRDEDLAARLDSDAMETADVYNTEILGDDMDDEDGDVAAYVLQGIPAMRALARRCATEGLGVVKTFA